MLTKNINIIFFDNIINTASEINTSSTGNMLETTSYAWTDNVTKQKFRVAIQHDTFGFTYSRLNNWSEELTWILRENKGLFLGHEI